MEIVEIIILKLFNHKLTLIIFENLVYLNLIKSMNEVYLWDFLKAQDGFFRNLKFFHMITLKRVIGRAESYTPSTMD